jgi:O-antigen ligase
MRASPFAIRHSSFAVRHLTLTLDQGALIVAVLAAVAIAVLPLTAAIGAVLITAVLIGTFVEPGIGLVVMLLAGPWAAWMNTYLPGLLPIDAGQIMVGLTLGAWGLHGLAKRDFTFPKSPVLIPLLMFVGWAGVTMLWAPDLTFGLPEVIKWIEIVVIMLFAIDLAQRRGLKWIVAGVLFTVSTQAVIGIYEARIRGEGPLGFRLSEGIYRAYGTFEQPNPFAGFIGLILPITIAVAAYSTWQIANRLSRRRSSAPSLLQQFSMLVLYGVTTALLALALYLSFSRGAWLAAVAAMGAMMAVAPRRLWMGLGLVMIAVIAVISLSNAGLLPSSISDRLADAGSLLDIRDVRGVPINDANYALIERQAHWQAAINMLTEHPWTGVGFSNYQPVYEQYRLLNWPMPLGHAHNIYLNVAAETGIPGLILYLFVWAAILVVTFKTIRRSYGLHRALAIGLMGTWVYLSTHNLVDNLYVNNTHLMIGALFGLLVILYRHRAASATAGNAGLTAGGTNAAYVTQHSHLP